MAQSLSKGYYLTYFQGPGRGLGFRRFRVWESRGFGSLGSQMFYLRLPLYSLFCVTLLAGSSILRLMM